MNIKILEDIFIKHKIPYHHTLITGYGLVNIDCIKFEYTNSLRILLRDNYNVIVLSDRNIFISDDNCFYLYDKLLHEGYTFFKLTKTTNILKKL